MSSNSNPHQSGIISLFALLSLAVITLGIAATSYIQQKTQNLRSNAATTCVKTVNVSTDQTGNNLTAGQDFYCYVSVDPSFGQPQNIVCALPNGGNICRYANGYGFKGYTGNTAKFKCNTNCVNNTNCSPDPSFSSGPNQLVGYDFSASCGPQTGTTINVNIAPYSGQPPLPTSVPPTSPPGVPTSPPVQPTAAVPTSTPVPPTSTPIPTATPAPFSPPQCKSGWFCYGECANDTAVNNFKGYYPNMSYDQLRNEWFRQKEINSNLTPGCCANNNSCGIPPVAYQGTAQPCSNEAWSKISQNYASDPGTYQSEYDSFLMVCGPLCGNSNNAGHVPGMQSCPWYPGTNSPGVGGLPTIPSGGVPPTEKIPTGTINIPTLTLTPVNPTPTTDPALTTACAGGNSWSPPGTKVRFLPTTNSVGWTVRPGGSFTPNKIVIHWSGQGYNGSGTETRSNDATYSTLTARGLSCQFGVGDNGIEQWMNMCTNKAEFAWCVGQHIKRDDPSNSYSILCYDANNKEVEANSGKCPKYCADSNDNEYRYPNNKCAKNDSGQVIPYFHWVYDENYNPGSISIEVAGCDFDKAPFIPTPGVNPSPTPEFSGTTCTPSGSNPPSSTQLTDTESLVHSLMIQYNIPLSQVFGHRDLLPPPQKFDSGTQFMIFFRSDLQNKYKDIQI